MHTREGRTAVLLIDTFNDFLSEGGKLWPIIEANARRVGLLDNLRRVVRAARNHAIPLVFVPHRRHREGDYADWSFRNITHEKTGAHRLFAQGTWGGDFHPDIAPRDGDIVATEHWSHNGFAGTDLDLQLRWHRIERLVIAGMRTNACFEATAREAVEHGYHITLLSDATAAFTKEEMDATLMYNAPWFAHAICPTETWIRSLAPASAPLEIA
jgi:nicotinamidase-related amidase